LPTRSLSCHHDDRQVCPRGQCEKKGIRWRIRGLVRQGFFFPATKFCKKLCRKEEKTPKKEISKLRNTWYEMVVMTANFDGKIVSFSPLNFESKIKRKKRKKREKKGKSEMRAWKMG